MTRTVYSIWHVQRTLHRQSGFDGVTSAAFNYHAEKKTKDIPSLSMVVPTPFDPDPPNTSSMEETFSTYD